MNKKILSLAIPNIITNITVPLLGMVDMAIVGHLSGKHIAAITIGTTMFNMIYWNFGFLRMGTSGLTAQAYGRGNHQEQVQTLTRSVVVALGIAAILLILQYPITLLSRLIFTGTDDVINMAMKYFFIRIWAAPATLMLYSIKGWMIGMQDSKTPMVIAIGLNVVNIVASLLLVLVCGWDIEGVALGTVVAQYSGLAMAWMFLLRRYRKEFKEEIRIDKEFVVEAIRWEEMKLFFKINGDIFLRTLSLCAVFTFITAASGRMGDEMMAVDALLLQMFTLFSYFMDGFAYAAESLVGRYIGARDKKSLFKSVRGVMTWGGSIAVVFTLLYAIGGEAFLGLFTDEKDIIRAAAEYRVWVVLVPISAFAAFVFDGIYVGATATRTMRNAMMVATVMFFLIYFSAKQIFGGAGGLTIEVWNSILWCAFLTFLITRGVIQWVRLKKDIYRQ